MVENITKRDDHIKEAEKLSVQIMELARDEILMSFRFLSRSLSELKMSPRYGIDAIFSYPGGFYYDPVFILRSAKRDFRYPARIIFHQLLHHIFSHPFTGERTDTVLWDIACNIAVENVIAELSSPVITLDEDLRNAGMLKVLREDIGQLSAEKIYRYFRKNPLTPDRVMEYEMAFSKDSHEMWRERAHSEIIITEEEWKKISRQALTEIKDFSEKGTAGEALEKNLAEGSREKYDYSKLLEHFLVTGEHSRISDDEFDYIYYTYGLEKYDGMPLIEPLEYREDKRIRDFVIAIDTFGINQRRNCQEVH